MSDRWTQHNMDKCGVAWWKMDEESGNILDSKGAFIGTPYNLRYDGEEGVYFNGTNSYIRFNNPVIPIGKKSIYFKIKSDLKPNGYNATIMGNTRGYGAKGIRITLLSTGSIGLYITKKGVDMKDVIIDLWGTKNICDGEWHNILITCTGDIDENGAKIYIDDMNIPNVQGTLKTKEIAVSDDNLEIGRRVYQKDNYLNANIRDIQIYNEVIDPIPKYYFIQTNDNKIWTYNTTWQDTGMVIGDLDYTNVSAKSNFETYGMFADENLSSQALQDLKDMGYTSYRVLMGKM